MPILLGSAPALARAFFGRGVGEQSCRRAAQAFAVDIHAGLHPSIWARHQQIWHGPARGVQSIFKRPRCSQLCIPIEALQG
mgnify:FL=1